MMDKKQRQLLNDRFLDEVHAGASVERMAVLLNRGAQANATTLGGQTALFFLASPEEDREKIELLFKHGIDFQKCDVAGRSVISLLEQRATICSDPKRKKAFYDLKDFIFRLTTRQARQKERVKTAGKMAAATREKFSSIEKRVDGIDNGANTKMPVSFDKNIGGAVGAGFHAGLLPSHDGRK